MRKLLSTLTILIMTLSLSAQGQMPIEVLGAEGIIVRRDLELSQDQAASATKLWLQINNLSYENKASVKVNTGTWYDLNHASVEMATPEMARGGMVHGGFNTVRLSIPVTNLVQGNNIIRFRFNTSDGISMGYRVVKMNLLNNSGAQLLTESDFEEDNPDNWESIHDDPASIAAGEDLWRNAELWANYLPGSRNGNWYSQEVKGNQNVRIKAKCAECHAQDGSDLEYFAYSNYSIIERSKFHGLSEYDGELIASYIRSLGENNEKIKRHGRPWNPPFQPGKELEGQPIEKWSAGAGLDAVLEKDADMLPYLFPDGVTPQTADEFFQHNTTDQNRTEIPLAVQLPDWKHWLPMIHPKDAISGGTIYQDTYNDKSAYKAATNSVLNPEKGYEVYRAYLESLPTKPDGKTIDISALNNNQKEEFLTQHEHFHSHFRHFFVQQKNGGSHWRTKHGPYFDAIEDVPVDFAKTSMARLQAVKNWEIMVEFGLQDQASDLYPSEDFPQSRQWLNGESKHVFEVPAHITGCDNGDCQAFVGQPEATGQYESSVWYELQQIIAGGEGYQWWNGPVDYNYQPQFILKASYSSGINEPLRYYNTIKTMYKVKSWSGGKDVGDGYGFRIRQQGLFRAMGKQGRLTKNGFYKHPAGAWPTYLNDIQPGLSKLFLEAMFQDFLDAVSEYDLATWPRDDANGAREGQFLGPISQSSFIDVAQQISTPNNRPIWSDNMMWVIPEAIKHGVDCQILDDVIDWCQAAWPNLDFNQFKGQSSPSITLFHNNSCGKGIEARAANVGNNPNYLWEVNGVSVNQNVAILTENYFELGDEVYLRINGTSSCATRTGVTDATITINEVSDCGQEVTPVDSAYYDFSDLDYSIGIADQWNGNDLSSLSASRVDDGVKQFASFKGVESASGNAGELEFTSAKATIESWINLNTNTGVTQRIVSINPSGAILFRVSPEGNLQAVLTNDIEGANTKQTLTSPNKLPNEVWTHVAASISESELIFYVNGQEDSRFDLNNPFDYDGAGSDLQIMLGSSNVGPVGSLDEVKIYNRTLSASEIQTSFESYNIKPEAYLSVSPSANITEGDIVDVIWGGTDVHGTITSAEIYRNGKIRNWNTPFQWTAIAGTHTIEVVVIDNGGAKDTIAVTLDVEASNVAPVASLSINPSTNITEGDAVNITFGGTDTDGTVESIVLLQNGEVRNWSSPYSWTSIAGQYTFEVIVTDNEGVKDTASVDIVVNSPTVNIHPVSNITASPNSNLRVGDVVTLTFGGTDADGTIESITLQQNNQLRSWSSPYNWTATAGTHEFEVMVTDNEGVQHISSITLNVSANAVPRANLLVVPNLNVTEGDEFEVTFSGSDSDGTIVSTTIQLNGVTQNWPSPQTITATKGTMLFEVIVEDNDGAISKESITIQVSEEIPNIEPVAFLGVLPDTNLIVGDEVEITFGGEDEDGTIESVVIYLNGVEQNWTSPHVWTAEEGEHTIEMVVTDNEGATNTISQSVVVEEIETGLDNSFATAGILLYPNPATDYFILDLQDNSSNVAKVELFSTVGDLIYSGVLNDSEFKFNLQPLNIPTSTIIVRITKQNSVYYSKLYIEE